jgi:hypothetical protein
MAYVDQSKKAKIAANLKKVVPAGWKYSLAVRNHSTIVLTISAAPVNLLDKVVDLREGEQYFTLNPYHYRNQFNEKKVIETFAKIFAALNTDNFDHSDVQTDYFHVGHYVDVQIGRWNKPFVVKK